jgi:hypothetical protein
MVLGKPSSITYGKPLVNTSYSSRTLRIRTLLSSHGTIRTPVSLAPSGWYGTLTIANLSGSEDVATLFLFSIIRDDTNQELLPSLVLLRPGLLHHVSIVRRDRLANPQTKLKIYWKGNASGISTIQTITGLNLVDYTQPFDIIDSIDVKANYTVDSGYIVNQPLTLIIKITPPVKTGFYGKFKVLNETAQGSDSRYIDAYLIYNNNGSFTETARINGNNEYIFTIYKSQRLQLPSSTLQLKFTYQSGTQNVSVANYNGFNITGIRDNPLNQEYTLSMLVNENNYDNGVCDVLFVLSYEPP